MNRDKLLFAFPPYLDLAKQILKNAPITRGSFSPQRFPNKELLITLDQEVSGKECIILGSISPPESQLFTFLVLCHTLKKEGAKKIIGFIPYLAYSRHEKGEKDKSQITALLAKLLEAAGLDELITIDIHNPGIKNLFSIPVKSLSPAHLFASKIKELSFTDATIVSPDEGAWQRSQDVADLIQRPNHVVHLEKKRTKEKITHEKPLSDVKEKVIIIDDILDTGSTLISCCEKLVEKGVKEMVIMVSHGLFTGKKWEKLWKLGVKAIYCTDSIDLKEEIVEHEHIHVIPIQSLWSESGLLHLF